MVQFPIHVSRDSYQGSNTNRRIKAMRRNEVAAILENHINSVIATSEQSHHQFTYAGLANKLGLFLDDVKEALFDQDCGHNGFSVLKE